MTKCTKFGDELDHVAIPRMSSHKFVPDHGAITQTKLVIQCLQIRQERCRRREVQAKRGVHSSNQPIEGMFVFARCHFKGDSTSFFRGLHSYETFDFQMEEQFSSPAYIKIRRTCPCERRAFHFFNIFHCKGLLIK